MDTSPPIPRLKRTLVFSKSIEDFSAVEDTPQEVIHKKDRPHRQQEFICGNCEEGFCDYI